MPQVETQLSETEHSASVTVQVGGSIVISAPSGERITRPREIGGATALTCTTSTSDGAASFTIVALHDGHTTLSMSRDITAGNLASGQFSVDVSITPTP